MNKNEIIEQIANLTNINKKDCNNVFEATFKVIASYLKKNESVNILNFGTFKVSKRKPRMGRNIVTQEKILIKSHKTITFKIANKLKEELN